MAQAFQHPPDLTWPNAYPLLWCWRQDSALPPQPNERTEGFLISHHVWPIQQRFNLWLFAGRQLSQADSAARLPVLLWRAGDQWRIPLRAWHLYQPPQGHKLYSRPRTRADKKNRVARDAFLRDIHRSPEAWQWSDQLTQRMLRTAFAPRP